MEIHSPDIPATLEPAAELDRLGVESLDHPERFPLVSRRARARV